MAVRAVNKPPRNDSEPKWNQAALKMEPTPPQNETTPADQKE
jgi:hypothetical protein